MAKPHDQDDPSKGSFTFLLFSHYQNPPLKRMISPYEDHFLECFEPPLKNFGLKVKHPILLKKAGPPFFKGE